MNRVDLAVHAALKVIAVIRNLYGKMLRALAKNGPRSKAYLQARDQISNELMNIRFGAKQVEALCDGMRKLVDRVRSHEIEQGSDKGRNARRANGIYERRQPAAVHRGDHRWCDRRDNDHGPDPRAERSDPHERGRGNRSRQPRQQEDHRQPQRGRAAMETTQDERRCAGGADRRGQPPRRGQHADPHGAGAWIGDGDGATRHP